MKIIVTGAAGFIGSSLIKKLAINGHSVLGIDALIDTTYSKEIKKSRWLELSSNENIKLQHLDMRYDSFEPFLGDTDLIFNLAAMPGLVESWIDFDLYLSCNVTATQKLLKAISNLGCEIKLIHISTSSVYGKVANGDEESEKSPFSPYGVTKLAAENLIQAYAANVAFDFNILRYFSVYGPGQRTDMAYSKFIKAIYFDRTIDIYGDGKQSRTNTYIDDCVDATIAVMERGKNQSVYNISGIEEIDVLNSIEIIEEIMGKKARLNFLPARDGDQLCTQGNVAKLLRDTNYVAKTRIYEGLRMQVEHFLEKS
jgi:UDP-glucuronate 4-epimerase